MTMTMTTDKLWATTTLFAISIFSLSIHCSRSYALRLSNHHGFFGSHCFRIDSAFLVPTTTTSVHHAWHPKSQLRLQPVGIEYPIVENSLHPPSVLCMGEILWDSLPSGIYLGGAPCNVAVHLASLFKHASSTSPSSSSTTSSLTTSSSCNMNNHRNLSVAIAACLGNDRLGREAHRRLSLKGVRTDCIQYHEVWETGMATATLNDNGDATYEFNTPAAWDGLRLEDNLMSIVMQENDYKENSSLSSSSSSSTKVIIMGTIAARLNGEHGSTSSSTLATIRNIARQGIALVLDVNLRSPWFTPESVIELARGGVGTLKGESPQKLALLKLNEEELCVLEQWCGLESRHSTDSRNKGLMGSVLKKRMERLGSYLNAQRVCVTRGRDGAALLCTSTSSMDHDGGDKGVDCTALFHESLGYSSLANTINDDCDSVGAGDAFLAALVSSLFLYNEPPARALERACALGGYVAGCRGAIPDHGNAPDELRRIFSFIR